MTEQFSSFLQSLYASHVNLKALPVDAKVAKTAVESAVDVPYSLVLRNLTLDVKVCLRNDKNAAFV